jgi:hypothetical protein
MEFIDKTKQKLEGEAIILEFLKEFGGNYLEDLYSEFKNPQKQKLIDLLLKEQNSRCCYCMRNLNVKKDGITLEHVIPRSVKNKTTFDEYIKSDTVLNETNVCLESEFLADPKTPPFPHTIAYQNLIVSCSGKYFPSNKASHCNSFRGNLDIKPIVLYNTIISDIEYKANGFIIWTKETDDIPTIEKLGLNDDLLRMIRRIWFYASTINNNLLDLDISQREKFLYKMLADVKDEEFDMLFNFAKDTYWELLRKYDYFKTKFIAKQFMNLSVKEVN